MPDLRRRLPNLPRLGRMRLSRLGLLLAASLLVCGSIASFALGQLLAHGSAAAGMSLEDQRVSLTGTSTAPSPTGAVGNGSTTSPAQGGSNGSTSSHSPGTSKPSTPASGSSHASTGSSSSSPSSPSQPTPLPTAGHQSPKSTHTQPQPPGNGKSQDGKPGQPGQHGHSGHGPSSRGHQAGQGNDSQGNDSSRSVSQTGNGRTTTVSSAGSSVTISSNGSGTSVGVSPGSSQQGQSSGSATCSDVQLRNSWPAVAEPLRTNEALIVPNGSAIPVHFQLQGACASAVNVQAQLYVAPVNGAFTPALPADGSSRSNAFRFDSSSHQYVYNVMTHGLAPGTYQLGIDLGNGQLFVVPFELR